MKKKQEHSKTRDIVNKMGIADIINGFIEKVDGGKIAAARIEPINIDLLSEKDSRALSNKLTGQLNGIKYTYEIMKVDRVVDLNPLINELDNTNLPFLTQMHKRARYILRKQAYDIVTSGVYREPRFYALIYGQKTVDIEQQLMDLMRRLNECGITSARADDEELMYLVNLTLNPIAAGMNPEHSYNILGLMPQIEY